MSKCYECGREEAGELCSVCGVCQRCCSHSGLLTERLLYLVDKLQTLERERDQARALAIRILQSVEEEWGDQDEDREQNDWLREVPRP